MKKPRKIDWHSINKTWTLFLDRDGVINKKIPNAYINKWEDFEFESDVLPTIKELSTIFNRIIIVTNQQGIQKGLMTEAQLFDLHSKMLMEIEKIGGKIDAIFYSPHLQGSNYYMRKPGVGMGVAAKKKFKDICFTNSVIVGDSFSDMLFGKRLGMKTVFVTNNQNVMFDFPCDLKVSKLSNFLKIINNKS